MEISFLFVIFFSFLIRNVRSQCEVAFECVTDISSSICSSSQILVPNSHIFNCCPKCDFPEPTTTMNPDLPIIIGEIGKCDAPYDCLPNGLFAPVQCKGDVFVGRCFCVDENGKRIFGQMWRDEVMRNPMNCGCSRRRAELEASGRSDVTLHCTDNGDYEPLQCDGDLCWCADAINGEPTAIPVNAKDMILLPCYNVHITGEQYLRKCESLVHALATIRQEQQEHNTNFLGQALVFCDYDGSYGPYQIQGTSAFCTNREGEVLGAWQIAYNSASDLVSMNCNCARDSVIHFPERGMTVAETCQGNGNYMPNQNVGDLYYCVDTDGYPTTDFLPQWPADNCASFA